MKREEERKKEETGIDRAIKIVAKGLEELYELEKRKLIR